MELDELDELDESVEFLSPAWFEIGRRLVDGVRVSPAASARLQFDAAGTRWHLVVSGGTIAAWDRGALDGPDVEIRWQWDDARRILSRELRGNDALAATTVVAATADGVYVGPPPPMDLGRRPELAALPYAPGASFGVQFTLRDGPFGDVRHALIFQDGRVVDDRLGELDDADVRIELDYRAMALVRCGVVSVLEAIEDGKVAGRIGPLAALDGILEDPAYHNAELATGRQMQALAALGELDANPDFTATLSQLARAAVTR